MSKIEEAKALATAAHEGQKRWNGDPYITHPERVAGKIERDGWEDDMIIVAWLHDVVEDTGVTIKQIEEQFGKAVSIAVAHLTKSYSMDYATYIQKLSKDHYATIVKMADLQDNLSDLKPGNMRDKYSLAYMYLDLV